MLDWGLSRLGPLASKSPRSQELTRAAAPPSTLGELKSSGYVPTSVRAEMRRNLVRKIAHGGPLFPGIIGYDDTAIPELTHALLAGQDLIILGERGQAKSRLLRSLTSLLDDQIPVMPDCDLNDSPFEPICRACRERISAEGDAVSVAWWPREDRYGEKLATPDVSMADLIGDIDPIKVAEGRYLSDETTINYGIVPRTNRGIFCINELPDLSERIQVGLFNLMEERDIQNRGHRVRLPLDTVIVATANPEDYTNRGRIITPLKDRYGAQVRTHYPRTIGDELKIVEQERTRFPEDQVKVVVPDFMAELAAELSALARKSPEVNQRSGVSVRLTIANYETLYAAAMTRALQLKEKVAAPRITDLPALLASSRGKIELESVEEGKEDKVIEELVKKASAAVYARRMRGSQLDALMQSFEEGLTVKAGASIPSDDYVKVTKAVKPLQVAIAAAGAGSTPAEIASAVEFVLEGLHLARRLNRQRDGGAWSYGWGDEERQQAQQGRPRPPMPPGPPRRPAGA
ncbi:MAG: sigma 54-interacting transcriptional regulator [Chloroflexi bacterium]|nr:sigma 54-interacting transcriptional regulator [Chloroflexota bacterium]